MENYSVNKRWEHRWVYKHYAKWENTDTDSTQYMIKLPSTATFVKTKSRLVVEGFGNEEDLQARMRKHLEITEMFWNWISEIDAQLYKWL